jgi:hypothetical protein
MKLTALILAAATAATAASTASAYSYFPFGELLESSDTLEIGTVTSEGAGVIEIYDYRYGTQGALLGTTEVNAGANTNVRVNTGLPVRADVLAVLKVNGEVVATKDYDVIAD